MEDFNTALLSIPNLGSSLEPLAPPLLGIGSLPSGWLGDSAGESIASRNSDLEVGLKSPMPNYKMPLGQDPLTGQAEETFFPASGLTAAVAPSGFIHQQGNQLIDGQGQPMTLRGISFSNGVWDGVTNPINNDHAGIDFLRVKEMGMNSVRFYLNAQWFEDDSKPYEYKATAWQWLDQNIAWAKQNGISLILNMHIPQGGYQSQANGDALWTNPANQQRLTALWTTIADRYKNETTIGGYGLVNEPIVTQSKQQWQTLAQSIATSIRQVDQNHLLLVEGIIGTKNPSGTTTYVNNADQSMIKINDSNTAYEFHSYGPFEFTNQGFDWGYKGDGGKYPDYNRVEYNPQLTSWYTTTSGNPKLAAGNTDWKYFEGVKYKVADPKINVGIPALNAGNVQGTVSYDDVVVKEFDPTGKLTNTFPAINTNSPANWNFWSSNGSGSQATTAGHNDRSALSVTGTTSDANISNYTNGVLTKQGYSYQISGWMKGENIGANANAQIRLDFLTSSQKIQVRDKAYLTSQLQSYIDWGKKNQVPMYLGEFGAVINAFKDNKGGVDWVRDMMDISLANKLSFNYHSYHEDSFGLYPGYSNNVDPTKVNQPLKQLFTTKLRNLK
jgi:endoglucanase